MIAYRSKSGETLHKPVLGADIDESDIEDGTTGWCLACGSVESGIEPDARRYTCEACKRPKVYGLEQLIAMGLVA